MEVNEKIELAREYINCTSRNVFLTGRAGTGKTTFLREIVKTSPKRLVVLAPTGIAAINAGGLTLHSFFQLPFGVCLPDYEHTQAFMPNGGQKLRKTKLKIIRSLELIIIDEVSMLRADLLDQIDSLLKRVRKSPLPFGGVQVLMIGDVHQLPPVVREQEWDMLRSHYASPYFFDSKVLTNNPYISIELDKIYRQSDSEFINLLEAVRDNKMTTALREKLNSRYKKNLEPSDYQNSIVLTTHNRIADSINEKKLAELEGENYIFKAKIVDNFPEYLYPQDPILNLKCGAQVMFTKNDLKPERDYVNGTLGTVEEIDQDYILVRTQDGKEVTVEIDFWENLKYTIDENTKSIISDIEGLFYQYPLKLAWAITIHKSQGLTFDNVIIDAQASFSHGQVYVALSRCRSLEGIILRSPIGPSSIISDSLVSGFSGQVREALPSDAHLDDDKNEFCKQLLVDVFDLSVLKIYYESLYFLFKDSVTELPDTVFSEFSSLKQILHDEIFTVSNTFNRTLVKLVKKGNQEDTYLKERLLKASNYFSSKLNESIVPVLHKFTSLSFDSQVKSKRYKENITVFLSELALKLKLWAYIAENGFEMQAFLENKAKIILETMDARKEKLFPKAAKPKNRITSEDEVDVSTNIDIYEELRAWRSKQSKHLGIPAYCITHSKTLIAISNTLPLNLDDLASIKGVGEVFIEKYGQEVLDICRKKDSSK